MGESDEEEPVPQEPVDAKQEGNDDEQPEKPSKKAKWFDRDRAVNRAHKALLSVWEKVKTSATSELQRLASNLQEVSSSKAPPSPAVRGVGGSLGFVWGHLHTKPSARAFLHEAPAHLAINPENTLSPEPYIPLKP